MLAIMLSSYDGDDDNGVKSYWRQYCRAMLATALLG
jgi:hypothetical protein